MNPFAAEVIESFFLAESEYICGTRLEARLCVHHPQSLRVWIETFLLETPQLEDRGTDTLLTEDNSIKLTQKGFHFILFLIKGELCTISRVQNEGYPKVCEG